MKTLLAILIVSMITFSLAPLLLPTSQAVVCPTNSTTGNGATLDVVVTGADGSCPPTYSSAPPIHYALSTANSKNPYTVTFSNCVGNCPPTNIIVKGWAHNQVVCGGSEPPCSATGPWTFNIDATVQAGKPCNTAPVKIHGDSGQTVLILEAGVGGVCSDIPQREVPEFGATIGVPMMISVIAIAGLVIRARVRK